MERLHLSDKLEAK